VTTPTTIGRYSITGELGRGAMGVVYRGVDPALDRPVAIKVISAQQAAGDLDTSELEGRFLREAKVCARINHPGVVTVYDAGKAGDSLFLVMELIDGESLSQRLNRQGYLSPQESFNVVAQVAEALAAAHALGVVHRDIKPANIMITKDGRAKVTDFGVAKAIGEGTELTRTGTVVGSPAYMAPEQVRGEAKDGRADLFSLGVVLYELLLHRKPFPADTVTSLIYQILNEDPLKDVPLSGVVNEAVASFLRRALAKTPAERIPDGTTFANEARAIAANLPAERIVDSTAPTRMIDAAAVSQAQAPAAGGASHLPRWVPVAAVAAGIVILAVGYVALRRPGKAAQKVAEVAVATPAPAAGEQTTPAAQAAEVEPTAVVPPTAVPPPTARPIPTLRPLRSESALRGRSVTEPAPQPRRVEEPARRVEAPVVAQPAPAQPILRSVVPTPAPPAPTPTPILTGVYECRQAAQFNINPSKAQVTINGKMVGMVSDFNGGFFGRLEGKSYHFPAPGTYYASFSAPGHQTQWVKIVVNPGAKKRIADIDFNLPKLVE
jgi:eukaryotic-like serine/threonine-protein kinase